MSSNRKNTHYFYHAYGLAIESDFELSDLVPAAPAAADVTIRLGSLDRSLLRAELTGGITRTGYGITARASRKAFAFHWRNVATAVVRGGRDVIIDPELGTPTRDLSPYINGSIFAVLLHQRQLAVLHASAVEFNGEAVAFLGDKGAGKSTFAAFLKQRGHRVLTDDLAPIRFAADRASVIPGFPNIKLWADAVESIGVDPHSLPTINSFVGKYSYACPEGFSNRPILLTCLYLLTEDSQVMIEPLDPAKAFIEVVRNCYLSRYTDALGQTADHFERCSEIARSVPVYRLRMPKRFDVLTEVSAMLEALGQPRPVSHRS